MTDAQSKVRNIVFYGVFVVLIVIYALIVFGDKFGEDSSLSGTVMSAIKEIIPLVSREMSVPGELAPAFLGSFIALMRPGNASLKELIAILLLSGFTWLFYLHLQFYASTAEASFALGRANVAMSAIGDAQKAVSSFASIARSISAATFAAAIGLQIYGSRSAVANGPSNENEVGNGGHG
ncbi:hypothetical protein [Agrobacterium rosae]|uniref:Uncharacterized protein n=1 Tax=Agrobacterium rosae TaxID=1972867 RepID=A0A1R3TMD8_9HYPH|nr:hypothetical protein [Agrobacterium rosae]SCX19255.1 hypothetical protein DSM25559_1819 [Agrobacterium rosae]